MTRRRRVRGMTLVALMVALLLGALLMLLAVELLLASRRSLLWQAAVTRLERAGDRGLTVVARELAMAGFRARVGAAAVPAGAPGCGSPDGWALALEPPLAFADRGAVSSTVLSDGSRADCLPTGALQPRSDLLALRRTATLPTSAAGPPASRRVRETQWYLFAGERGQGDFRYFGDGAGPSDLPADGRRAWEWHTAIFYVRAYSVARGDGVPALCVERLQGAGMRSRCLVEGVERLHVEFAVDSDGDGRSDVRLPAPGAAELRQALRATIYLHVRTLEPLRQSTRSRELRLGSERVVIPAGDPFVHRVFVRTVPLVNLQ